MRTAMSVMEAMAMAMAAAMAAALMLAGCGQLPFGHPAVPRGGETITYAVRSTPICYGCPSYTLTLGPDGQGIFTGEHGTAVAGDRRFLATPSQVSAFTSRLREYRPNGEVLMTGPRFCKVLATDQDTVDVRWQAAEQPPRHLAFYGGCDMERNAKMAAALSSAPKLLPIADLVGHR